MSSDDRTTAMPRTDSPTDADGARTQPLEQRTHEDDRPAREDDRLARDDDRLAREDHLNRNAEAQAPVETPVVTADRREVVAAERERYGGVKVGSAFFGWLTAMGTAVLLTALLAAAGTAVGLSNGTTPGEAAADAVDDPTSVGVVGAVALGALIFVAYYCGGYVAGRMARFDGGRQGVAVWLWAIIVALAVALLGVVAGDRYNVLAQVDGFPRFPVGEGDLTTVGIVALVIVLVTSLLGAVLGGLAGMRFHRRVDRAGLGD